MSSSISSQSASQECIDVIIWVGSSYKKFFCAAKKTCAVPFKWNKDHCFVHEAEWRGISRKVPAIPKWAVSGRTRVFLAHRGGLSHGSGKIFGYYVLGRTEVMLPEPTGGSGARGKDKIRTQKCPDGKEIVTHKHVHGRWVRTKEKCASIQNIDCGDRKTLTTRCPDGSVITVARGVNGRWKRTRAKCPTLVSILCEKFKVPRDCLTKDPKAWGLRLVPGAVYAVDALDAAITDAFCKALHKAGIPRAYERADDNEKAEFQHQAHTLFLRIARETRASRRSWVKLPNDVARVAYIRGSLVMFKRPPIYEAYPSASFKGIKHIDGNLLLEQIIAGQHKVFVMSCHKPGRNSMTNEEIAGWIAARSRTSQALAESFLHELAEFAESELCRRDVFGLRHLGTFRVNAAPGRALTKAATKEHLATELDCKPAAVGKLIDGLAALAREQVAAGRDFRLHELGTFTHCNSGVRFREAQRMRNLNALCKPSTEL